MLERSEESEAESQTREPSRLQSLPESLSWTFSPAFPASKVMMMMICWCDHCSLSFAFRNIREDDCRKMNNFTKSGRRVLLFGEESFRKGFSFSSESGDLITPWDQLETMEEMHPFRQSTHLLFCCCFLHHSSLFFVDDAQWCILSSLFCREVDLLREVFKHVLLLLLLHSAHHLYSFFSSWRFLFWFHLNSWHEYNTRKRSPTQKW